MKSESEVRKVQNLTRDTTEYTENTESKLLPDATASLTQQYRVLR
jgi:hypothetical protein